jgi:hypothetical protein
VLAPGVVILPGQPGPDPKRQRIAGVQPGQHMRQPLLEQHRAGHRAALADPQSGQAQRGQRHGGHIAGIGGQPVGAVETLPAGLQVTVDVLGASSVRERDPELVGVVRGQFQAGRGRHRGHLTRLTRHGVNVFAADPAVEAGNRG